MKVKGLGVRVVGGMGLPPFGVIVSRAPLPESALAPYFGGTDR